MARASSSMREVRKMSMWMQLRNRPGWADRAARSGMAVAAALLMALALAPAAQAGGGAGIGPMGPHPAVSSGPPAAVNQPDLICDGSSVAKVAGLSGSAQVQGPNGAVHPLGCDGAVRACETVITGPGAQVSLTQGGLFAQLGANSRVQIGGGSKGPSFFLHDGTLRVIDQRTGKVEPYLVTTPQAKARANGGDAQIQVLAQRAAATTQVCSEDARVSITGGKHHATVAPGMCSQAEATGLTSSPSTSPAMQLAGPMQCSFSVSDLADLFQPGSVAAPPMAAAGFPTVGPASIVQRQPCDVPGAVCGFPLTVPGPPPSQTIGEQQPGRIPVGAPGFGPPLE